MKGKEMNGKVMWDRQEREGRRRGRTGSKEEGALCTQRTRILLHLKKTKPDFLGHVFFLFNTFLHVLVFSLIHLLVFLSFPLITKGTISKDYFAELILLSLTLANTHTLYFSRLSLLLPYLSKHVIFLFFSKHAHFIL